MMKRLEKKGGSRIALYMLLLVAAVCAMVSLRVCRQEHEHASAEVDGVKPVRVAIQYSPVTFFVDGDTLGGFDYTLLQMTDLPVRIFPVADPSEGLAGLEAGRYDLLIADMPQSVADSGLYAFTVPAYIDRQVLVQLTDSVGGEPHITSVLQLAGDTVYVTKDSPMAGRLRNIVRETGSEIHVKEVATTSEKLVIGRVLGDVGGPVVVNERVAQALAADYPRLDYSLQISFSQFQPWVVRASDGKLLDIVNARLDSIRDTPAYARLVARYFD
ncbi:MAG: transporter substrate-binding domain-containing protein [Muribaculaceae bacterium]|nr:transporter substrate-binding domain-containing protein [Muribaculaceae bacterium]